MRAVTARDAPPSASSDEAEDLYNASPYVNIKCEYGYIQSTAGRVGTPGGWQYGYMVNYKRPQAYSR